MIDAEKMGVSMFRTYVLRNRSLAAWLGGSTALSGGCDAASGALGGVALLLQVIAGAL